MMDHETQPNYQPNFQRRLPKSERRVRFADTMGMELVSIFLIISNYYFSSFHKHKALQSMENEKQVQYKSSLSSSSTYSQPQAPSSKQPPPTTSTTTSSSLSSSLLTPKQQHSSSSSSSSSTTTTTIGQHHHHHQSRNTNAYTSATSNTTTFTNNKSAPTNHNTLSYNNNTNSTTLSTYSNASGSSRSFVREFTQPISLVSFKERVRINRVQLETCQVNSAGGHVSVSCTIRVANLSYDKSVIVRYTTDDWHTSTDSLASYKPGSYDGWSDQFTSTFSVNNQLAKPLQAGRRILFAIRYIYGQDNVHWDNNGGLNYAIKVV